VMKTLARSSTAVATTQQNKAVVLGEMAALSLRYLQASIKFLRLSKANPLYIVKGS
jgi:hypothetical protein